MSTPHWPPLPTATHSAKGALELGSEERVAPACFSRAVWFTEHAEVDGEYPELCDTPDGETHHLEKAPRYSLEPIHLMSFSQKKKKIKKQDKHAVFICNGINQIVCSLPLSGSRGWSVSPPSTRAHPTCHFLQGAPPIPPSEVTLPPLRALPCGGSPLQHWAEHIRTGLNCSEFLGLAGTPDGGREGLQCLGN